MILPKVATGKAGCGELKLEISVKFSIWDRLLLSADERAATIQPVLNSSLQKHFKKEVPSETPNTVTWSNGCDRTVPKALRYLASNPRPAYGQHDFNAEHLYQLADEIEQVVKSTTIA